MRTKKIKNSFQKKKKKINTNDDDGCHLSVSFVVVFTKSHMLERIVRSRSKDETRAGLARWRDAALASLPSVVDDGIDPVVDVSDEQENKSREIQSFAGLDDVREQVSQFLFFFFI